MELEKKNGYRSTRCLVSDAVYVGSFVFAQKPPSPAGPAGGGSPSSFVHSDCVLPGEYTWLE